MKVELHKEALAEYVAHIEQARHALTQSKRTLLILCSQASAEVVAILLHKLNVLDISTIVKHNRLDSKNWWDGLPQFQNKNIIANLASEIESARNKAYGNLKEIDAPYLLKLLKLFFELKHKAEELANEKFES